MLSQLRHAGKMVLDPAYREKDRLLNLPRRQAGTTRLLGPELHFVDGRSCCLQYQIFFENHLYGARFSTATPRIIDAGANIGLASLYWKSIAPHARISAFEADGRIAAALSKNVQSFNWPDIEIHNCAVSDKNGHATFAADGSDGGRLDSKGDEEVSLFRLRDMLDEPVDLLKLDIEGVEVPVIFDCAPRLKNVSLLFVEYHSFADRPQILPEFLKVLRDADFRLFIQTDYCPPSPLREQPLDHGMDLRLNIFGIRK